MRFDESRRLPMRLAGCLLMSMSFTPALAAQPLLSFKVDADTTATVTRVDASRIRVRLMPGNLVQTLPDKVGDGDDTTRYAATDVNFDGHLDLVASVTEGMVNDSDLVYLYDPASRQFKALRMPAGNERRSNCGDLTNLDVKPAERTLYSSCRSGPIWYSDAYRYRADGSLYLYQVGRMPTVLQSLDTGAADGDGPPRLLETYDEHGRTERFTPQSYGGGKLTMKVGVAKLPLHDGPHDGPTRRYVVSGDTLDLIDSSDADATWLQVRFRNPKAGTIVGWIRTSEAVPPEAAAQ